MKIWAQVLGLFMCLLNVSLVVSPLLPSWHLMADVIQPVRGFLFRTIHPSVSVRGAPDETRVPRKAHHCGAEGLSGGLKAQLHFTRGGTHLLLRLPFCFRAENAPPGCVYLSYVFGGRVWSGP